MARHTNEHRDDAFVDLATRGKHKEVHRALRKGQPVDVVHSFLGTTALMGACEFGHGRVVDILLAFDADPNIQRHRHADTALMRAAAAGRVPCVHKLLQAGANKSITNAAGQTALDICEEYSKDKVRALLRDPPLAPHRPIRVHGEMTNDFDYAPPTCHPNDVSKERGEAWKPMKTTPWSVGVAWKKPVSKGAEVDLFELRWLPVAGGFMDEIAHKREWAHIKGIFPYERDSDSEEEDEFDEERGERADEEKECCEIVGLQPATDVQVQVRARNTAGWSGWSEALYVRTSDTRPGTMTELLLARKDAVSVTLVWTPPLNHGDEIDAYELQYQKMTMLDGDGRPMTATSALSITPSSTPVPSRGASRNGNREGGGDRARERSPSPTMSFHSYESAGPWMGNMVLEREKGLLTIDPIMKAVDLDCGTYYHFRMRAHNVHGWGALGPVSAVVRTDDAPYLKSRTSRSITAKWLPMLGAIKYELQYRDNHDGAIWITADAAIQAVPPSSTGTKNFYRIDGLYPATGYMLRCRGYTEEDGWGLWENCAVSAVMVTKNEYPEPCVDIRVIRTTSESVTLQWPPPIRNGLPIDAYRVQVQQCSVDPNDGESDLKNINGGDLNDKNAWATVTPDYEEYMTYQKEKEKERGKENGDNGHGDDPACPTPPILRPIFTCEGLKPGITYRFRVNAHNGLGWSKYRKDVDIPGTAGDSSETEICRTDATVPCTPPRPCLITDGCTPTSLSLEWREPITNGEPIDRYELQQLQCSIDENDIETDFGDIHYWMPISEYICDGPHFTVDQLEPGIYYEYRIRAHNKLGWSKFSCHNDLDLDMYAFPGNNNDIDSISGANGNGISSAVIVRKNENYNLNTRFRTACIEPEVPSVPREIIDKKHGRGVELTVSWTPPICNGNTIDAYELQQRQVSIDPNDVHTYDKLSSFVVYTAGGNQHEEQNIADFSDAIELFGWHTIMGGDEAVQSSNRDLARREDSYRKIFKSFLPKEGKEDETGHANKSASLNVEAFCELLKTYGGTIFGHNSPYAKVRRVEAQNLFRDLIIEQAQILANKQRKLGLEVDNAERNIRESTFVIWCKDSYDAENKKDSLHTREEILHGIVNGSKSATGTPKGAKSGVNGADKEVQKAKGLEGGKDTHRNTNIEENEVKVDDNTPHIDFTKFSRFLRKYDFMDACDKGTGDKHDGKYAIDFRMEFDRMDYSGCGKICVAALEELLSDMQKRQEREKLGRMEQEKEGKDGEDEMDAEMIVKEAGLACAFKCNGLRPGLLYEYRVRAHNITGWSGWSKESFSFLTSSTEPDEPAPPYIKDMTGKDVTQHEVILRWHHPLQNGEPIHRYELQIKQRTVDPNDIERGADLDVPLDEWFTISDAIIGTYETDVVFSVHDSLQFMKMLSSNSINSHPCADGFGIDSLEPGISYEMRLRANNSVGWSRWSHSTGLITTSSTVPDSPPAPKLELVTNGKDGASTNMERSISIVWQAPITNGAPLQEFEIEHQNLFEPKGKEGECSKLFDFEVGQWEVVGRVDASDMNGSGVDLMQGKASKSEYEKKFGKYTLEGLLPFTVHRFRVRAHNILGWSEFGPPGRLIRTNAAVPSQPDPPELVRKSECLVVVEWEHKPGETDSSAANGSEILAYELEKRAYDLHSITTKWESVEDDIGSFDSARGPTPGGAYFAREFQVEGLPPVVPHWFRVRAKNHFGWGPWSEPSLEITTNRRH